MDELEKLRLENEQLQLKLGAAQTHRRELLPGLIAMSLIAIMAFSIVMLFLQPMPMTEAAGTLAVALVTAVTTNVGVVVGFFFGSSKTNKDKDATILAQAQAGAPRAATTPAPPATGS